MKKILTGFMAVALIATVGSTTVLASCGHGAGHHNSGYCNAHYNQNCRYIDENGDGICDNYGENGCPGYHRNCVLNGQPKTNVSKQAKVTKVSKAAKTTKKAKAAKASKAVKKAKAAKISKKAKAI